jgi:hypothetical protein
VSERRGRRREEKERKKKGDEGERERERERGREVKVISEEETYPRIGGRHIGGTILN